MFDDVVVWCQALHPEQAGFRGRVDLVVAVEVHVHRHDLGDQSTRNVHINEPVVEARFAAVPFAIAVGVIEDRAVHRGSGPAIAEIDIIDDNARFERDGVAAVRRCGWLPRVVVDQYFAQSVFAGRQVFEPEPARLGQRINLSVVVQVEIMGRGAGDRFTMRVAHVDDPAVESGFLAVLDTVAVAILELLAVDTGMLRLIAEVDAGDHFTGADVDDVEVAGDEDADIVEGPEFIVGIEDIQQPVAGECEVEGVELVVEGHVDDVDRVERQTVRRQVAERVDLGGPGAWRVAADFARISLVEAAVGESGDVAEGGLDHVQRAVDRQAPAVGVAARGIAVAVPGTDDEEVELDSDLSMITDAGQVEGDDVVVELAEVPAVAGRRFAGVRVRPFVADG